MNFRLQNPNGDYDHSRFLTNLYIEYNKTLGNSGALSLRVTYKKFEELLNLHFPDNKLFSLIEEQDSDIRFYDLKNDKQMLLFVSINGAKSKKRIVYVKFYYNPILRDEVINFLENIRPFSNAEKKTNHINVVINDGSGLSLSAFEIKKPRFLLEENYDDITEMHNYLIKRLNTTNDKGIALFYGAPGCGKTNYIRYLLATVKKRVIYLPPDMAGSISSPDFVPFLMNYPNSILVIEDAENIIKKREVGGTQSISNLLNLGDGLLSDILNIQIIATFNCNYKEIDEALLRKGRLICKHEFQKLSMEKGQALSDKLGFKNKIEEALPLSEIYNQDEKDYSTKKKHMGFNFLNI